MAQTTPADQVALMDDGDARDGGANEEAGSRASGFSGSATPLPQTGLVIVRLSSIGDIVLTEPVVTALRDAYPDATIGFAVKERYRELVEAHPAVDRVHALAGSSFGDLRGLCEELRAASYSCVVDLHRNQRSVLLGVCARASMVTAYRKRNPADAVRVRLGRRRFRADRLLVRRYLDSLRPLGVVAKQSRPRLYVSPEASEAASDRLRGWGLRAGSYAVVAPGALWETKRWPVDRFASVVTGLAGGRGLDVLLVGSASERALCEQVAGGSEAGRATVVNGAGDTGLGELAALLGDARLFIGNDSGPMHMAMARGTPTVAIFGPTDPGQFDFTGDVVVFEDLECSACSFYGTKRCRLGHWRCMTAIEPDRVLSEADALLDRRGGTPEGRS